MKDTGRGICAAYWESTESGLTHTSLHGWADHHQALLRPGCSHPGLKVFPLKHNEIYLHKKNVRKLELPPGFCLWILSVAHNWSRPPGVLGHLAGRQAGSIFQSWESVLSYLMVCTHLHHSLSLIHLLAYFKDSSSRGRQFSSWARWLHALFKAQKPRCLWQCPSGQPSYCHIPSPSSEPSLQLPCTPRSSGSTFLFPPSFTNCFQEGGGMFPPKLNFYLERNLSL